MIELRAPEYRTCRECGTLYETKWARQIFCQRTCQIRWHRRVIVLRRRKKRQK